MQITANDAAGCAVCRKGTTTKRRHAGTNDALVTNDAPLVNFKLHSITSSARENTPLRDKARRWTGSSFDLVLLCNITLVVFVVDLKGV